MGKKRNAYSYRDCTSIGRYCLRDAHSRDTGWNNAAGIHFDHSPVISSAGRSGCQREADAVIEER